MCKLLIRANRAAVAVSYYDEMERMIDRADLLAWAPELAADVLAVIASGLNDKTDQDRKRAIVSKIALIDTVKAFEFM